MTFTIIVDDMRAALASMEPESVDSIVTDPPYEYGFMGKAWDSTGVAFDPATWAACWRVLKPGGHLLAFGATRTVHRIACAIEDAGFDIRDQIAWMFGSGFPKSLDVSKAIDKAAGATRNVGTPRIYAGGHVQNTTCGDKPIGTFKQCNGTIMETSPATADAARWQGWGTALKPAMEPIIVARKPIVGTVAANVLAHRTGAINVYGCRIGTDTVKTAHTSYGGAGGWDANLYTGVTSTHIGRWPANVILDDEAGAALDEQSGDRPGGAFPEGGKRSASGDAAFGVFNGNGQAARQMGDSGGASRFFYSAKADGKERDAGLENLPTATRGELVDRDEDSAGIKSAAAGAGRKSEGRRNTHATVKPIDLMRYLCRLVTPPGGTVLDPFFGSGTTGVAALLESFSVIGVEMQTDHACIAWHRCNHWSTRQLAPGVTARSGAEKPTSEPTNLDLFGAS